MELFSADTTTFSKDFFAPENMKKTYSKVAHNRPKLFFSIANLPKDIQIILFELPYIMLTYSIC